MDVIGYRGAVDSEKPPNVDFPWHTACALAAAFFLGTFGLHWTYVLPIFWVLLHMDERRRRKIWALMKRDLIANADAGREARKDDEGFRGETVSWINQLVRAVWPMYEPAIAGYTGISCSPTSTFTCRARSECRRCA